MERKQSESVCVLCFRPSQVPNKSEKGSSGSRSSDHLQNVLGLEGGSSSSSLCSRCKSILSIATSTKREVEETERDVRRRQLELLRELKRLEEQVSNFKVWMMSVDHVIEVSRSGSLERILERQGGGHGLHKKEELLQFREKVLSVIRDLQMFQKLITTASTGRTIDATKTNSPAVAISKMYKDSGPEAPDDQDNHSDKNSESGPLPKVKVELTEIKDELDDAEDEMIEDLEHEDDFESHQQFDQVEEEEPVIALQEPGSSRRPRVTQDPLAKRYNPMKECKVCGKSFTRNHLGVHMRLHTKELPYKCDSCGKRFRQWSGLGEHRLKYHPEMKPYECDQCDLKYATRSELKSHVGEVHGENYGTRKISGSVECEVCGKVVTRLHYKVHMRVHNKERPYKCESCPKSFTQWSGLASHRKSFHPEVKPYKCQHCEEGYSTKSELKVHSIHVHGFRPVGGRKDMVKECKECGKSIKWNEFKAHQRSHEMQRDDSE